MLYVILPFHIILHNDKLQAPTDSFKFIYSFKESQALKEKSEDRR